MKSSELKSIREDTGLSQSQFAGKLGIAKITLQKWEQGLNPIPEWGSKLVMLTAKNL